MSYLFESFEHKPDFKSEQIFQSLGFKEFISN